MPKAKVWPALILCDDISSKEWVLSADRQGPYTIGRSTRCDCRLTFDERATISSVHAEIEYDEKFQSWVITDLGSKSGTVVIKESQGYRRNLLSNEFERLGHGDRIQLGGKQYGREYRVQCLQWNLQREKGDAVSTSRGKVEDENEYAHHQESETRRAHGSVEGYQDRSPLKMHEAGFLKDVEKHIDDFVSKDREFRSKLAIRSETVANKFRVPEEDSVIGSNLSSGSDSKAEPQEEDNRASHPPRDDSADQDQQESRRTGSRRSKSRSQTVKNPSERSISLYRNDRKKKPKAQTLDVVDGTALCFELHQDPGPSNVQILLRAASNVKESNLNDPGRRLEQHRRATQILSSIGMA